MVVEPSTLLHRSIHGSNFRLSRRQVSIQETAVRQPSPRLTERCRVSTMYTACIQMGREMTTEVGLRIRVDEELRRQFLAVCHSQDTTAAQTIRAFMRTYVQSHVSDEAPRGATSAEQASGRQE